ncbi:PLC-like phosphodiesterase [Penicillium atrosanguineum]|uniref:PLC-like phosphodiesterase n=1 Tax=Penicillium atrosanguineum TaxID=1132637 RepID=A0A9W9PMU1_9EURO|nr:PLC-like phosphodiesterase [Penicillium atrosanguineum]KAJ5119239.1 PLC-like phosphodiesterase [Penicillium atrosanguineum]KAJ5299004.1 PLC-like phosphodiesterase [Penicillium atrosanguineum]
MRFWVTHLNDELAEVIVGNTGKWLEDVLTEMNRFTKENPGEIIFFRMNYLIDLRKVPSLGPIYWTQDIVDDFFTHLKTLNNWCGDLEKGFHNQKASYFMDRNDGAGCVIFVLDGHLNDVKTSTAPTDGIYPASQMNF